MAQRLINEKGEILSTPTYIDQIYDKHGFKAIDRITKNLVYQLETGNTVDIEITGEGNKLLDVNVPDGHIDRVAIGDSLMVNNGTLNVNSIHKDIYVNCNSTEIMEDGTITKPFKTIQRAINSIPSTVRSVVIHVSNGEYAEDINVSNAMLSLAICGNSNNKNSVRIKSGKFIVNCLSLRDLSIYGSSALGSIKHALRVDNTQFFSFANGTISNDASDISVHGICAFSCIGQVENVEVKNVAYGIRTSYGANCIMSGCVFTNCTYAEYANMGVIYSSNNTVNSCENKYYCDGGIIATKDSAYVNGSNGVTVEVGTPIGTILKYAGNGEIPAGYLLCDNSSVSRTTYAKLFAVIGDVYGCVDNQHFNLPPAGENREIIKY